MIYHLDPADKAKAVWEQWIYGTGFCKILGEYPEPCDLWMDAWFDGPIELVGG